MAVDSVNNNSNAGYVAGAALVGGGAGAPAGWYSKPFLKDGAPTDAFVKKMSENIEASMSPEDKELAQNLQNCFDNLKKSINDAKNVDELKEFLVKTSTNGLTDEVLAGMKESDEVLNQILAGMGIPEKDIATHSEMLKNSNSAEDFRNLLRQDFDKRYAGKTLEEIKSIGLGSQKVLGDVSVKSTFNQFWDSSKKTFVNCEEGVGKVVKKAAQSIQGKYAAIYGAVGAGVLGLATLLCCGGKKEAPEKDIDA